MADLTWTLTAPYMECVECHHPGPPDKVEALTIAQPHGADVFHLIPHRAGCHAPNPFNGPAATVNFDRSSALTRG